MTVVGLGTTWYGGYRKQVAAMSSTSARTAATDYLARGWAPIPIPWRAKAPTLRGWPELRITADSLDEYFNGAQQNIGVLFGDLF